MLRAVFGACVIGTYIRPCLRVFVSTSIPDDCEIQAVNSFLNDIGVKERLKFIVRIVKFMEKTELWNGTEMG